ncbi:MAG: AbrB/MazE/SpoVT family DNA-binding domain-containing protein [Anaerolineae bacterium]|nr:AbrB/MazE/SpoVT family DNA-binding domain-containing protein [Anaerolineae bacterium]
MLQTKLSTKGQVIIPRTIRDAMRLEPGVRFEVEIDGNCIILKPIEYIDPIDVLYGLFAGEKSMLDDLEAEHAAEVAKDWD